MPGPHCHVCVRLRPHYQHWRDVNLVSSLPLLDLTRHERCHQQPRHNATPTPDVTLMQLHFCGQVCHSFNKIGPWKDASTGSASLHLCGLPSLSCADTCCYAIALHRTTMPARERSVLNNQWSPARAMPTWMLWTRLDRPCATRVFGIWCVSSPYRQCFGLSRFESSQSSLCLASPPKISWQTVSTGTVPQISQLQQWCS